MKRLKFKFDETKTVARNARLQLTKASQFYFKAGRETLGGEATPAELHAFRLQTKRFRYTLELFRMVYGPTLERMLDSLHGIQQLLGEVNDCVAARKLILASGDRRSIQVRRVLNMLDQRQAEKTAELGRLWLEFDRAGAADRWLNYLAIYAGRARKGNP